ncbi:MAG: hypothetical protein QG657_4847 [Acidobacteriota bacterium]|nr:hypothetical protein [Acidobacteriota bacterium]
MKKQKACEYPIDNFLKQTLKDDLPPEVEDRLYIQLRRFQEKTDKQQSGVVNLKWILRQQLVKSAALVFAVVVFVILLATAGFVPLTNSQNLLAESLSTFTTSINVFEQILRSSSMDCSVETTTEKGDRLNYSIKWTPGSTRVQVFKPDNSIVKTLEIIDDQVTIIDHTSNTLHYVKTLEQLDDPLFQRVMDFISPTYLQERLQMKWKSGIYWKRGDCDEGIFTVLNSQEKADMEISVDMCTLLPTKMTTYRTFPTETGEGGEMVIKVQFAWETPPIAPRLSEQKNNVN